MLDTGKKRRWATYQNDPIKAVSSYICWSSNVSIIEIHAKKIWWLMHYNEKWKANRINCKFLRMIKSCYQVNEKGWYTIKCTLQTHLCHNNDVPGCAPAPGEAGKLPQVFFFHKQYILSSLCFIIYQWFFLGIWLWSLSICLVWSQPTVEMNFTSFGRISMKGICVFLSGKEVTAFC